MIVLFLACAKPCDLERLQIAQTADDISAACRFPEPEKRQLECSSLKVEKTYDDLQSLHLACQLDALASTTEFALSKGDPVFAAWSYKWMQGKSIVEPEQYAKIILGDTSRAEHAPYARVEKRDLEQVSEFKFWGNEIQAEGTFGTYPYWHVDLPFETTTLALDPELSVRTVRFLLASLSSSESPLKLVVLADELGTIDLYPPTDETAKEWSSNTPPTAASVVRIDLPDTATVKDLIGGMDIQQADRIELSLNHAPCFSAPDGMRCVAGQAENSTLYVDTAAVSSEQITQCRADKMCRSTRGSFTEAAQLCAHQGKRLPTRTEIQFAEISEAQWTRDWNPAAIEKGKRCGDSFPCWYGTKKLLVDGTSVSVSSAKKHPVYCVSDRHILNSATPFMIASPLTEPSLSPPTEAEKSKASSVVNDPIDDKGICGEDVRQHWREQVRNGGRSSTKCRDPKSYVTSNEPFRQLWHPYIKNLGGGYVGVGSDQSYDFIASQRASWGWVFDYDPNVYRLHRMMIPMVVSAETPQDLVDLFAKGKVETVKQLLVAEYGEEEGNILLAFYQGYRHRLFPHYTRSLKSTIEEPEFGWLSNPDNYAYIRKLMGQGRIVPVAADMLGNQAMQSIGRVATEMGVPVRVFYVSNAPLAWGGKITEGYRQNVQIMPFDDQSVFLATYGGGGFGQKGYWHYFTASAHLMRDRIASQDRNEQMIWDRFPTTSTELTVAGLPERLPRSTVEE